MSDPKKKKWLEDCVKEGPQWAMAKQFMEQYLDKQGYSLADLKNLPPEKARALRIEACNYASLKLAQVESKVGFREKIRG